MARPAVVAGFSPKPYSQDTSRRGLAPIASQLTFSNINVLSSAGLLHSNGPGSVRRSYPRKFLKNCRIGPAAVSPLTVTVNTAV